MRYIVLGAGAIGGAIGGRLHQHGESVVLVARGAHQEVMAARGLELRDPDATALLDVAVVPAVAAAEPGRDDVVLLATKSQQSDAALAELAACAPASVSVVCAQNGVANEAAALRRFPNVYGMRVIVAATHLEAGVVEISTAPVSGILDIGRFPRGEDELSAALAAALARASFDARSVGTVMDHKYLKLLANLSNAIEAACGHRLDDPILVALDEAARREARACFEAAGIVVADPLAEQERRSRRGPARPVGGIERHGGSSFQSLARRTGDIEADYLNGEIVLLGRLYGVPTPVNERLQAVAGLLARTRAGPGSIPAAEVAAGLL